MKKGLIILLSCVAVGGVAVAAVALTEHKHTAGDWVVDQEATCTQEGKRHQVCEKCGETLTEEAIPVKEHRFSSWKVTREATCTEEEVSERICEDCGLKDTSYASAKGHNYFNEVILQEPTCTETGKKTFSCSACGLTDAEEVIPSLGHDTIYHNPVKATCTDKGVIEYWSCKRCSKLYKDKDYKEEITQDGTIAQALGHSAVYHAAQAATCEKTGNIEYWTCSRCKEYFKDSGCTASFTAADTVTTVLGHIAVHSPSQAADCTCTGTIEYWTCSRCNQLFADESCKNKITEASTIVSELGHKLTHHNPISPDCTNAGQIGYWSCDRCNKLYADAACTNVLQESDLIVSALGHKAVYHSANAADCTKSGNIEYWTCSRCNGYFKDSACTIATDVTGVVTAALGHVSVHHPAQAAYCTSVGNIEYWTCSRCNHYFANESCKTEITKSSTALSALGHNTTYHNPISPDCTNAGQIGYWSCSRCNGLFADASCDHELTQADLAVDALGHKAVYHSANSANCTKSGNIEYWTCSRCNGYFKDSACTIVTNVTGIITASLGHVSVHHPAQAAYCTTVGNIEYWTCSRCNHYFANESCKTEITQSSTVLSALGHNTTYHNPISPDCTSTGQIGFWSCNRCSGLFADAACGHELTQADLVVNALGHQAVYHSPVAVTCFTDGSIEHWTCSRCSKYFGNEKCTTEITQASTVISHGHTITHYDSKAAECTVDGNIEYWKCSRCSGYFSNSSLTSQITQAQTVLTKLGHTTTHYDAVAENCTTDGNMEYWHCSRCNKNYSDSAYTTEVSSVIIAAHHTGTYTCTICGYHGTYTIGSYPQTQVTNETQIAALNALAGDDPIAGNATSGNWTAYEYYAGDGTEGSEAISYFMFYQDVTYQGQKYRGVYLTAKRPYITHFFHNFRLNNQDLLSLNTTYWYKYEPLNWVVLSETSTQLFLLADKALDSQSPHHTKSCAFASSDIRSFLNVFFYNTAFSSSEKARLIADGDGDRVSLLNSEGARNAAYGFAMWHWQDPARVYTYTDYAYSQGLSVYGTICSGWFFKDCYSDEGKFTCVNGTGQAICINDAYFTTMGVVPVITVSR